MFSHNIIFILSVTRTAFKLMPLWSALCSVPQEQHEACETPVCPPFMYRLEGPVSHGKWPCKQCKPGILIAGASFTKTDLWTMHTQQCRPSDVFTTQLPWIPWAGAPTPAAVLLLLPPCQSPCPPQAWGRRVGSKSSPNGTWNMFFQRSNEPSSINRVYTLQLYLDAPCLGFQVPSLTTQSTHSWNSLGSESVFT